MKRIQNHNQLKKEIFCLAEKSKYESDCYHNIQEKKYIHYTNVKGLIGKFKAGVCYTTKTYEIILFKQKSMNHILVSSKKTSLWNIREVVEEINEYLRKEEKKRKQKIKMFFQNIKNIRKVLHDKLIHISTVVVAITVIINLLIFLIKIIK